MSARRRRVRRSRPCSCQARSSLSKEHQVWLGGSRDSGANATIPGGLRASLKRSWIGGATFARDCKAASPCPSAATVANSLIGFLVAEHAGVLIVKIDLTWIGPVSQTFPFGSDPPRSAPLKVAALRTAQTIAAEKIHRGRTDFPRCMPLSACVADSSGLQRRARQFWPISTWHRRTRRNKRRKLLRPRADGVPVSDESRERSRCPWTDQAGLTKSNTGMSIFRIFPNRRASAMVSSHRGGKSSHDNGKLNVISHRRIWIPISRRFARIVASRSVTSRA